MLKPHEMLLNLRFNVGNCQQNLTLKVDSVSLGDSPSYHCRFKRGEYVGRIRDVDYYTVDEFITLKPSTGTVEMLVSSKEPDAEPLRFSGFCNYRTANHFPDPDSTRQAQHNSPSQQLLAVINNTTKVVSLPEFLV